MNYKIGLDAAVRTCGIAILEVETQKLQYFSHISKEKDYFKLQIEMADWVFEKIGSLVDLKYKMLTSSFHADDGVIRDHILIMEDLYVGPSPLSVLDAAKLQGAIIDRYYSLTDKFPEIISALTARKKLGLETNLSKAEYQLWIIDRYNLAVISEQTRGEIIRVGNHWERQYKNLNDAKKGAPPHIKLKLNEDIKELNKETKNALNRLSKQLTKETGIDEHMSDAIILVS
jgi:Holliday junction resolvasome RuvABC endonuclease subunit